MSLTASPDLPAVQLGVTTELSLQQALHSPPMCGICGFVSEDPRGIDRTAMLTAVGHRGPDGAGEWTDESSAVWLGHSRLAILDPSPAGAQPMASTDGRWVISYNGEIYNFLDVRRELTARGYAFRSRTDTEVLLNAWNEWGSASLSRLRGMFAFALWDTLERRLWLVRDRMGEKPLYYFSSPGRLLFSSSVRSLLASTAVPRRIDGDGLDAYLTFGSNTDPFTLVAGVRSLEPGRILEYEDGRAKLHTYWSIRDVPEESSTPESAKAVGAVAATLRDSCLQSLVSDVPLAVLLSGGIDSSSNVALLTEHGVRDLSTFSVTFEGPDVRFTEKEWSDLVASRFGTRHVSVPIGLEEARQAIPRAVASMDLPSYDGVNTYFVAGAVRAAGLKVAVTGQGADELFLGYPQRHGFPWLLRTAQLPYLRVVGRMASRALTRVASVHDRSYEKALGLIGSDDPLASAYLAQHSLFSQAGLNRLRGGSRPPQLRFVPECGGVSALGKLSRLELMLYLRNTLLRDGDQMGMAHGVELRAPFVDHQLVELVLQTPVSLKVDAGGAQKPLLVKAVGPALPSAIVSRPKQGFALPYDRWLRNGLSVADIDAEQIGLMPDAVNSVHQRFLSQQHWPRFWTLQVLAAWANRERMLPPAA